MKKEVMIAVTLGLIVGLVIAVGMYRAQRAVDEGIPEHTALLPDQLGTPLPSNLLTDKEDSDTLRVVQPPDEFLSRTEEINVSGQTTPNTPIVVLHNEQEIVGSSDEQGNFSLPLTLKAGSNILHIRALHSDKDPSEVLRTVVYSSVAFNEEPVSSPSASPRARTTR